MKKWLKFGKFIRYYIVFKYFMKNMYDNFKEILEVGYFGE